MDQYERISQAIEDGAEIRFSNGFNYDGTMSMFTDSLAQVSGILIKGMLREHPDLTKRKMKISYVESGIIPPNEKSNYKHIHVEVTVTWLAE